MIPQKATKILQEWSRGYLFTTEGRGAPGTAPSHSCPEEAYAKVTLCFLTLMFYMSQPQ